MLDSFCGPFSGGQSPTNFLLVFDTRRERKHLPLGVLFEKKVQFNTLGVFESIQVMMLVLCLGDIGKKTKHFIQVART